MSDESNFRERGIAVGRELKLESEDQPSVPTTYNGIGNRVMETIGVDPSASTMMLNRVTVYAESDWSRNWLRLRKVGLELKLRILTQMIATQQAQEEISLGNLTDESLWLNILNDRAALSSLDEPEFLEGLTWGFSGAAEMTDVFRGSLK